MTENEAIKEILNICCNEPQFLSDGKRKCKDMCMYGDGRCAFQVAISALKEIQQYREIGTVEECREAVEKRKPKKPHRNYKKFSGLWCKCGWYLGQKQCLDIKYCPNCGQALDENLEGMEDG